MSARDGSVTFTWADGEHTFRLGIKQLEELQEKCNAGPPLIMARLANRMWLLNDVRETLRLGLIGGEKMDPAKAVLLINRYASDGQLMAASLAAYTVIAAALVGPADEPGKSEPAKEGENVSPMAA